MIHIIFQNIIFIKYKTGEELEVIMLFKRNIWFDRHSTSIHKNCAPFFHHPSRTFYFTKFLPQKVRIQKCRWWQWKWIQSRKTRTNRPKSLQKEIVQHDENDILHLSLHEFQGQNQELLEVFQRNCNKTDSRNLHSKISVQSHRHSNYLEILQLWLDDVWLHEDISSILTNHFGTSLRSPEKTTTIFFSTQTLYM